MFVPDPSELLDGTYAPDVLCLLAEVVPHVLPGIVGQLKVFKF